MLHAQSGMLRSFTLFLLAACRFGRSSGDESDGAAPYPPIPLLDIGGMQKAIMAHEKFVLLMHATGCERAEEFAPKLAEIAAKVPGLAYGRVNVEGYPKERSAAATGVQKGAPALKAFFRNAPPQKRVLEYAGVPSLEAVLDWAKAVDAWDGSDKLAPGWEIGGREEAEAKKKNKEAGAKKKKMAAPAGGVSASGQKDEV